MAGKRKDKKGDRPSLGTGLAENAAQKLEGRGSRIDRAVTRATGQADKTKDKPQGKADKD